MTDIHDATADAILRALAAVARDPDSAPAALGRLSAFEMEQLSTLSADLAAAVKTERIRRLGWTVH